MKHPLKLKLINLFSIELLHYYYNFTNSLQARNETMEWRGS